MSKRTTYQKVFDILAENQQARNNDKITELIFWRQEGLHLTPEQERIFLENCTKAWTIRRERQRVQSAGYFPPTDKVKRNRKELEHQYKSQVIDDKQAGRAVSWLYDD